MRALLILMIGAHVAFAFDEVSRGGKMVDLAVQVASLIDRMPPTQDSHGHLPKKSTE
jgi:hypothetical protein